MRSQEWRERADTAAETLVMDLTLPSGMVVRARRPGPLRFARWGRLPMMLGKLAAGAPSVTNEEIVETMTYLRELLVWCVVDPVIALDGGPETMHPRDVPDADLYFMATWAMRVMEAEALRPFRRGGATDGGDGGGEDLGMPAVGAAGDRGPGPGPDGGPGSDVAGAGDSGAGGERPGGPGLSLVVAATQRRESEELIKG